MVVVYFVIGVGSISNNVNDSTGDTECERHDRRDRTRLTQ